MTKTQCLEACYWYFYGQTKTWNGPNAAGDISFSLPIKSRLCFVCSNYFSWRACLFSLAGNHICGTWHSTLFSGSQKEHGSTKLWNSAIITLQSSKMLPNRISHFPLVPGTPFVTFLKAKGNKMAKGFTIPWNPARYSYIDKNWNFVGSFFKNNNFSCCTIRSQRNDFYPSSTFSTTQMGKEQSKFPSVNFKNE